MVLSQPLLTFFLGERTVEFDKLRHSRLGQVVGDAAAVAPYLRDESTVAKSNTREAVA
jgi:hypothetical protein